MSPLPATAETPDPASRRGQPKGADTIVCRELAKIYETRDGHNVLALASINLSIKDGEFLTVVGPSGCGKSTLLKVLGGLTEITRGEALLNGSPIVGPRRDIGVVFPRCCRGGLFSTMSCFPSMYWVSIARKAKSAPAVSSRWWGSPGSK